MFFGFAEHQDNATYGLDYWSSLKITNGNDAIHKTANYDDEKKLIELTTC